MQFGEPRLAALASRADARGLTVTVRVDYDDAVRVPLVGWLVGGSVRISAAAVMRQEFG